MINHIKTGLKGVAMGCADVVPGVSGGTIALLTGIYPRLIHAITQFNPQALKLLFKGQFRDLWKHVDAGFLLPLLVGIVLAFVAFAHSIKYAIENHPVLLWSFFFGLIIASAILIIKNIEGKELKHWFWLLPGAAVGYWIGIQSSLPFPDGNWAIFIAAMIAICAMILPGISGSFILLLLGMYEPVITAITNRDYGLILLFVAGAVVGLMLFSRVIEWILKHFYQLTLFFLSGLMLGSLAKIWPWKLILSQGLSVNILPGNHPHPQWMYSLSLMAIGLILVFVVDWIGQKFTDDES